MNKAIIKKRQIIIQAFMMLGIIIFLNIIFNIYYKRIDLTGDKRYTLSEPTINLLKKTKDVVYVKVYLEGDDLPASFRRLHDGIRDILDEFRRVAGDRIQYQFINPNAIKDPVQKKSLYKLLVDQGLRPLPLEVKEEDKLTQQIIFPGAIVTYNNNNMSTVLLEQQMGNISPDEVLNNSITQIEYKFANTLRKLMSGIKPKIGIVQGHGELAPKYLKDIEEALSEYYRVDYVNSPKYRMGRYDDYAALIVAKPDSTFKDVELYKLDQYIMKGGKVLFCIDALMAELDSFDNRRQVTYEYPIGKLKDMLYQYGVRINSNLAQDLNCHYIPLLVGSYGGQAQRNPLKWPFYPMVTPVSDHPIVNGLSGIWFQFANTLDTVNAANNPGVKRSVLLQTSPNSRTQLNPVVIELDMVRNINSALYNAGPKNLAVLLEGSFNTAFRNYTSAEVTDSIHAAYITKGKPSKIIVISDGDVIKNSYSESRKLSYPLGYDPYTNQYFANKNLILNCIDYMVDESGLISLRSKQFKLRMLDAKTVKDDRVFWQVLNTVVPIILIIIFGIIYNYVRKRRFSVS